MQTWRVGVRFTEGLPIDLSRGSVIVSLLSADRLLQLLQRPREYIQLHRDTTVQSLTLSPSLVSGRVVYEDSPLVRALQRGFVLMIDEVDKAPTEVVGVLKALLEDGEILLTDGRRFVTHKSPLYD